MINIIEDCNIQAVWNIGNFKIGINSLKDFTTDILKALKDFLLDHECKEFQIDEGKDYYTIYIGFPIYVRINQEENLTKLEDDAMVFIKETIKEIKDNIEFWLPYFKVEETEKAQSKILKQIEEIELLISASNL